MAPLNPRKWVFDFVRQTGGQFAEPRGMLAAIDFAFLRHRLGDVAHHHQVRDYLSRLIAHRRKLRWSHPTAFLFFLLLGGALMALGIAIYLFSLVSVENKPPAE